MQNYSEWPSKRSSRMVKLCSLCSSLDFCNTACIVGQLHGSCRKVGAVCLSSTTSKLCNMGRDIDNRPVPETTRGWGIGIVHGNHNAFCSFSNPPATTTGEKDPAREERRCCWYAVMGSAHHFCVWLSVPRDSENPQRSRSLYSLIPCSIKPVMPVLTMALP